MKTKRILFLTLLLATAFLANGLQAQGVSGVACQFFFNRYNSDKSGEKVAVEAGETLGAIHYRGWTPAAEYQTGATISSVVTAAPAEGYLPANLVFSTGAAQLYERMTITPDGLVGIGTPSPSAMLHVEGNSYTSQDLLVGQNQFTIGNIWAGGSVEAGTDILAGGNIQADQNVVALERMSVGTHLTPLGNVRLLVDGGILAGEVEVIDMNNWPDYVFLPDYKAPTAADLEIFIRENGHLPGIPSAAEIHEEGLKLGEMQARLLEKIEELTLIIIQQQKEIDSLKAQLNPAR
jgi:hypothetical protein